MSEGLGLERTRAFEAAGRDRPLPDLTSVRPVTKVTGPVESDIFATYFDTADLHLRAQQITLRHLACDDEVGWDVHLADGDGLTSRVDVAGDDRTVPDELTVPEELTDLIRASLGDRALAPVATIRTVRAEWLLLDADGAELARLGDDLVHGQRFTTGQAELTAWREVEVEVAADDEALLDAIATELRATGLTPSTRSRLDRALGHGDDPVIDLRDRPDDHTVGEVVRRSIRDEVALLLEHDRSVRRGRDSAVHDVRMSVRRLRADLVTWRPFLDPERTDALRRELGWLGGLLGALRDARVLEDRLVETVRGLPPDMVVGPVEERVGTELRARRAEAEHHATTAFESARYFGLVDLLESFAGDPPLTGQADEDAEGALARRVAHAVARLDRAMDVLDAPGGDEVRADRLHDVRKAARRAGQAATSVEPLVGRRARRLATRMDAVQDALGDHQDSVVARQALREISAAAHLAGESAFTYGILHGIERDRGEAADAAFEVARAELASSATRRWATT